MIKQLNPPIPLSTPKGDGLAWAMIDYGVEHNLMWVVAIDSTGEIWTYDNSQVRAQKNITMGRFNKPTPFGEYQPGTVLLHQANS